MANILNKYEKYTFDRSLILHIYGFF